MSTPQPPPPLTPPQTIPLPTASSINNDNNINTPQPQSNVNNDVSSGILITVLVLAIAVILSASLYLLLKFLHRRTHHHHDQHNPRQNHHRNNNNRVSPSEKNPITDTLPLFTFDSLTGAVTSGDCAVCLSKFESKDLLRLLPICCHAFHVECIDTWLNGNQSCPLCRSPVFLSDSELLGKFRNSNSSSASSLSSSSRSFRVEIGNISRRPPASSNSGEIPRRSYSISGNYDYVLGDGNSFPEVPAGSFRWSTEFKGEAVPTWQDHEALANEVGPRGGWLKDYLSQSLSSSSSRTASFRGSSRWFFNDSGRRDQNGNGNNNGGNRDQFDDYMEAGQLGDEISELFRWLSGV